MGFQLVIAEGKEAGREFVFDQPSVLIGRTSECDVVLYDPGVSRKHARVFNEGEHYFVEDMGSSNGTKVNGAIIKKKQLADGDAITLGPVVFNFAATVLDDSPGGTQDGDGPPQGGEQHTRIVAASEVKRSRNKGVAMVPENAQPDQLEKLARTSTRTMQAVSRPRNSSPGLARQERGEDAPVPSRPRGSSGGAALSAADRARIKRQQSGASAGFTIWWAEASKRQRGALVGAVSTVVLALGGAGVWFGLVDHEVKEELPPEPTELSNQPIEYSFGLGEGVQYPRADQKIFDFQFNAPVSAAVIIHYQAKDISAKEVSIAVNGIEVGEAPADNLAVNERANEVLVPAQVLKKGEVNKVAFDSTRNPPGEEPWRIWNLWVEVALLPPLSSEELIAEADRKYRKGMELWERKDIGAANRYEAWKAFRTAWLYLESLPEPRPEKYVIARDKMKEAQADLDRLCAKILLEANTAYNQRRFEDARLTLEHVVEFFPNKDQTCPFRAEQMRDVYGI